MCALLDICHVKCLHPPRAKFTTGARLYENTRWLQNLCRAFVSLYTAIAGFLGGMVPPLLRGGAVGMQRGATAEGD